MSKKLVGGFNPSEKYYSSQIGSFPQVEVKIKNMSNHQLENLPGKICWGFCTSSSAVGHHSAGGASLPVTFREPPRRSAGNVEIWDEEIHVNPMECSTHKSFETHKSFGNCWCHRYCSALVLVEEVGFLRNWSHQKIIHLSLMLKQNETSDVS